jgi:dipeptidyl aminopeptidase/acylaminoacyl peptidase
MTRPLHSLRSVSVASLWFLGWVHGWLSGARAADVAYRKPPQAMLSVLHAPEILDGSLSPANNAMMRMTPVRFPPIAELAQPWLSLAGVRVAPRNRSIGETYQNGETYWSAYCQLDLNTGAQIAVDLPQSAKVGSPVWSADGKRYAFARIATHSIELWLGEVGSAKVRRVEGVALNRMLGEAILWMPDQQTLLVKAVPDSLGEPPSAEAPPVGPGVQETSGDGGASSTYEAVNVLRTPADERLFDFYARSQPKFVDFATGIVKSWARADLIADLSVSPNGALVLVETVHRPYSHVTAWDRFPRRIEILDLRAAKVGEVADLPLSESVPIGGVPSGPRGVRWRPTAPATLVWTEALDGGDLGVKVPRRDKVMAWDAPFSAKPREIASTEHRLWSLDFAAKDGDILVTEFDAVRHWSRTWHQNADRPAKPRLIRDISSDERYADPGLPLMQVRGDGTSVLLQDGDQLFLRGLGATPQGERPFLDLLDLRTLKTQRLFRSDTNGFEYPFAVLDVLTRRFFDAPRIARGSSRLLRAHPRKPGGRSRRRGGVVQRHPPADPHGRSTPVLRQIKKRLVSYKRADGMNLSFKLHLPPGHQDGQKLPAVMYAYPLDYTDARTAGQVGGSTRRFARLGRSSQLYFLLAGYAVLDDVPDARGGERASHVRHLPEADFVRRPRRVGGRRSHRRGGHESCGGDGPQPRRPDGGQPARAQSALQGRHRPQRWIQQDLDRIRVPARGAHPVAGSSGVPAGLAAVSGRLHPGSAIVDPWRGRRQSRNPAPPVRAALPGDPGQRRHCSIGDAPVGIARIPGHGIQRACAARAAGLARSLREGAVKCSGPTSELQRGMPWSQGCSPQVKIRPAESSAKRQANCPEEMSRSDRRPGGNASSRFLEFPQERSVPSSRRAYEELYPAPSFTTLPKPSGTSFSPS